MHCIFENVRTKCIIFGEAPRIRVNKFKQNLRENYSKSTKIAITACKFSQFFRGSEPSISGGLRQRGGGGGCATIVGGAFWDLNTKFAV